MSYIELPSGSRALLADVLQCCLFQRKYRTPLTASVGPSSFVCRENNRVSQERVSLEPTSFVADFQTRSCPFDEQHSVCYCEEDGGKEAGFDLASFCLFCRVD